MNSAPQAYVGFGQVRHTRLRPRRNAFVYPTCFLLLPMRDLAQAAPALARNRWAPISFYDCDHGDGRTAQQGGALAWVDELLRAHGIDDADGQIWLHCYPRVWGHTFKPVSFWYCERADGSLRAVLVEVNNTFGERHCYLLDRPREGQECRASKVFHVSPFCQVQGWYRFRFMRRLDGAQPRTVVRIDHDDAAGPLLQTSVSGTLQALDAACLRQALWAHPALTLLLLARIHWQALKLWLKRTGLQRKPEPPKAFVSQ
ncbi:MAG: DUF1365 domain-containing protein [Pseudomonadota bacterium]